MLQQMREAIRRHGMLSPGDCVVVAVSGGADSTALLLGLHRLAPDWDLRLVVAHLDHGLRPESREEKAFVERLARGLGWPFEADRIEGAALSRCQGRTLEEAARMARYGFLQDVARGCGADRIAMGHHREDQAETVLMNVIRGSGLDGLRGMRPVRDGVYIRPLLDIPRGVILAWLEEQGQPYMTDASNETDRFTRNRIRRRLLPLLREWNPRIDASLGRMAEICRIENEFLEGTARRWISDQGIHRTRWPLVLEVKALAVLHEALQGRILKEILLWPSPEGMGVSLAHVRAVQALLRRGRDGGPLRLPFGLRAFLSGGRLILDRIEGHAEDNEGGCPGFSYPAPIPGEIRIAEIARIVRLSLLNRIDTGSAPWNERPAAAFLDYDRLAPPLVIRSIRPGDRMRPLGLGGAKKLQDLLTDDKVPRWDRRRLPILEDRCSILWIGGGRIAERGRVTSETAVILRVEIV